MQRGVGILGRTLVYKILEKHLVAGELAAGEQIGIRIDQTLTQDATGTTALTSTPPSTLRRMTLQGSISPTLGTIPIA